MKPGRSFVSVAIIGIGLSCLAACPAGAFDTDTTAPPETVTATVTASDASAAPVAPPAASVTTAGWQRDETIIVSAASGTRDTDTPRRSVRTWLTDSKGGRTTHPTHLMVRNDGTKYCTVWGAAIRFASHGDSFATTVEAGETRFFALPPDPDENITTPNTIVTIEWWNDGTLATLPPARPAATPTPYHIPEVVGDPYNYLPLESRSWYYAPSYTYRPYFYSSFRTYYDGAFPCPPAYVGTVYSNGFNNSYQYVGEGFNGNGYYAGYAPGYVGPPIVYATTVYAAPTHHEDHPHQDPRPAPAPVGLVRPPHQAVGVRRVPKRPMITQMATQPTALPPGASFSPVTPPADAPAPQTMYTPTVSVRSPEPARVAARPQPGRLDLRNPVVVARPAATAPPQASSFLETARRERAVPSSVAAPPTEGNRRSYQRTEAPRPLYRQAPAPEAARSYSPPAPAPEVRRPYSPPAPEVRRAVVPPPPAPAVTVAPVRPTPPAPASPPAPAKPSPPSAGEEGRGPRGGRKP